MGGLRSEYDHSVGGVTIHVSSGGKRRSGLTLDDYVELINEACRSWRQNGIEWLRGRFGNEYRGHLGVLGTALVACYARQRCYDFLIEPLIRISGLRINTASINPDIALVIGDRLLILEVKLHHREVFDLISQIDDFIAEFEGELRGLRVYMGILHMFTTRPTQVREGRRSKPRWVVEVVLATKSHQDIYSELDTVIKDLMR